MSTNLIEVTNLKKHFPIRSGLLYRQTGNVYAVDGVSFNVKEGETLGIVGESGCGKSTLGRTLIRIYDPTEGEIIFSGKALCEYSRKELRTARKSIQMVFQDPYSSLNPKHTIGRIVSEPLRIHTDLTPDQRQAEVIKILDLVGLNKRALEKYPHEFSGGQRQRVAIARAIILKPKLVIADEPVSALDVSIQSQILNLLQDIQEQLSLSYVFIAHDLAVVKYISHRIAVMYLGKIVEITDKDSLFRSPMHPYTQSLMNANPVLGEKKLRDRTLLTGDVPSPINPPDGCHFHPRCPYSTDLCKKERPVLQQVTTQSSKEHMVACHYSEKLLSNSIIK